jgi:hypothetical protein
MYKHTFELYCVQDCGLVGKIEMAVARKDVKTSDHHNGNLYLPQSLTGQFLLVEMAGVLGHLFTHFGDFYLSVSTDFVALSFLKTCHVTCRLTTWMYL